MVEQQEILQIIYKYSEDNVISLAGQQQIAGQFNCSLRDVEHIALQHSIIPARFKRNSLSCHEQLRLFRSRVAIIGCGGLGGRTAELLARLGIGHLILTDPDTFSESNLNRQIFCTPKTLGRNKVEVVADELTKINPVLKTTKHKNHFNAGSISTAHIVIDGLDSPEARIKLSQLCQKRKVPMVHGAVKEWYGQVGIDQPSNRIITTLYSQKTGSLLPPKVLPVNVALIASIQAAEATKFILGYESALQNGWLQTDLLHCEYDNIPTPND